MIQCRDFQNMNSTTLLRVITNVMLHLKVTLSNVTPPNNLL